MGLLERRRHNRSDFTMHEEVVEEVSVSRRTSVLRIHQNKRLGYENKFLDIFSLL